MNNTTLTVETRTLVGISEKISLAVMMFAGATAAVGLLVGSVFQSLPSPSESLAVEDDATTILRSQLIAYTYDASASTLSDLVGIASAREKLLLEYLQVDPASVAPLLLSPEEISDYPSEIQPYLEQPATVSGVVSIQFDRVGDDGEQIPHEFLVKSDGSEYTFVSTFPLPDLDAGSTVEATGLLVEDVFIASAQEEVTITSAGSLPRLGPQHTLVLLVNFSNNQSQVGTVANWESNVFTGPSSLNAYYQENSYGQMSMTGDVKGWYTLTQTTGQVTTCEQLISAIGANTTIDSQVDWKQYRFVIIGMVPGTGCSTQAISGQEIVTQDGTVQLGTSYVNLAGITGPTLHSMTHEYGHTLGLFHGNGYECHSSAFVGNCHSEPYDDPYDVMGFTQNDRPHISAPHKERLSWLSTDDPTKAQLIPYQNGTTTVTLTPFESASAGIKMAKVFRLKDFYGDDNFLYLEYRTASGFDTFLGSTNSGVYIHFAPNYWETAYRLSAGSSHLIDSTPTSANQFGDSVLKSGQQLVDSESGVSFRVVSSTATEAVVEVSITVPTCADTTLTNTCSSVKPKFCTTKSTPSYHSSSPQLTMPRMVCVSMTGGRGSSNEACDLVAIVSDPKPEFFTLASGDWRLGRSPFLSTSTQNQFRLRSMCDPDGGGGECVRDCWNITGAGGNLSTGNNGLDNVFCKSGTGCSPVSYSGCASNAGCVSAQRTALEQAYYKVVYFPWADGNNTSATCDDHTGVQAYVLGTFTSTGTPRGTCATGRCEISDTMDEFDGFDTLTDAGGGITFSPTDFDGSSRILNLTNRCTSCGCAGGASCSQTTGACCTPNCTGKICGSDGCGGTCAPGCPTSTSCSATGAACVTNLPDPTRPCFLSGTQVLLADGSTTKAIEEIVVGDRVMAYNEVEKTFTPSVVTRTYTHQATEYLVVNDVMRITPNHQVITPEGRWVPIVDLGIGDEMVGPDGNPVRITSMESITADVPVYNLEIDVYQTYIADGVVVHNARGKVPAL